MNTRIVWISSVVALCLASVFAFLEYGENEVDMKTDRYELKNPCSTLIKSQINMEMHASLVYMNMAAHFDRNTVARKGFARFFRKSSEEEREHAQKLIDYLNVRGGQLTQFRIDMPDKVSWNSGLDAINDAIELEKDVYNQLSHLHDVASEHCRDLHLMDFLEREYLDEQVQAIDALIRHSTELGSISNDALGEYLYDRKLLKEKEEL